MRFLSCFLLSLACVLPAHADTTAADYTNVLEKVYVAYFGRPADPEGLAWYAGRYRDAGAPTTLDGLSAAYYTNPVVHDLLDSLGTSVESQQLYPGATGNFVEAIYHNLFNRAADAEGKAYWVKLIDSGILTRANAAVAIMSGARDGDITVIANKTAAATAFTRYVDTPALRPGYAGTSATAAARAMLATVGEQSDPNAVQEKIVATVPQMFGTYAVPTDLAALSYPASYTVRPAPGSAAPGPCDLEAADARYPDYYLGNYPLPAVTGAPLAAAIERGIVMKDAWDTNNPSFAHGCSGSIRTEMSRTLARLKALGANRLAVIPWTFFSMANTGWTIQNPGALHTSTMDDSDLAWTVQQAHADGIKVSWLNQIQGATDSTVPPGTQDNLDKFFAAYEPYMLERAEFLQRLGVDEMQVSCTCFTFLEADSLRQYYEARMAALVPKVRAVFKGAIRMKDHPSLATNATLAGAVDYMAVTLWANMTPEEVPGLTVAKLKAKFLDALRGMATVYPNFSKPVIFEIGVPSRSDYFSTGYVEETFCTAGFDTISGSQNDCFQRRMTVDFALQAMYYEAYLEALAEQTWFKVHAVESRDYWPVNGLAPSTTFPNLAFSVRNKPAEGILKAWFARP